MKAKYNDNTRDISTLSILKIFSWPLTFSSAIHIFVIKVTLDQVIGHFWSTFW